MARDFYHAHVKAALRTSGWAITHDPYRQHKVDTFTGGPEGAEITLVADREQGRYLLLHYGWLSDRYIYAVYFHIDIRGGKIWLQRNMTEDEVVDSLMAAGVPAEDIVIGLVPPEARAGTPFAEN